MGFLPGRGPIIAGILFIGFLALCFYVIRLDELEEKRPSTAPNTEVTGPWSVPGFLPSKPMGIWRDPDTGCQYLIMPDGDPAGRREGTPCPDGEWLAQQAAKPSQESPR